MYRLYWCECGQKIRVPEDKLGATGHCPNCHVTVTPTWANTVPRSEDAPERAQPQEEMAGHEAPPEETPVVEAPARSASPPPFHAEWTPAPPRVPPPPPLRRPARDPEYGFDSLLRGVELAMDRNKISLAQGVALLWVAGCVSAAILALGAAYASPLSVGTFVVAVVLGLAAVVWTGACMCIGIGGVARLVEVGLTEQRTAPAREGWAFIGAYWPGLAFGPLGVGLLLDIALGLVNGMALLVGISMTGLGPILVTASTIPLFLVNLFLMLMASQVCMLPCIMAVEQCGAGDAVKHLATLLWRRTGAVLAYEIAWLIVLGPMIAAFTLLVAVALGPAIAVAAFSAMAAERVLIPLGLLAISALAILAYLGPFLWVYAIAGLTLVYEAARGSESVYEK